MKRLTTLALFTASLTIGHASAQQPVPSSVAAYGTWATCSVINLGQQACPDWVEQYRGLWTVFYETNFKFVRIDLKLTDGRIFTGLFDEHYPPVWELGDVYPSIESLNVYGANSRQELSSRSISKRVTK